jgi:hypothetical protein
MSDHHHIVAPRADRYGHPEKVLTAPALTSDEHVVAAPYCDKYGHIVGDDQRLTSLRAVQSRFGKNDFVLR